MTRDRLQVIVVDAVPLRDRPDDVLPLTHYFLEKFAAQYGATVRRLTAAAEDRLLNYAWPGNVRELQNCIQRTVLMNGGNTVDADDIAFMSDPNEAGADKTASDHASLNLMTDETPSQKVFNDPPVPTIDPWASLRNELMRFYPHPLRSDRT